MRKPAKPVLALGLMALLAAGCAPGTMSGLEQVLRFPEADLERVLPGPGGVYRSPVPVPYVSLDSLTDPDPRISDNAFRTLRRLRDDIPINRDEPPEYGWRFGMYYMSRRNWPKAAQEFDWGLKAMGGAFSFDREGRDVWDYGYMRALAYLQYEPEKAVRDARILVAKAAPARAGVMPQLLLGQELLVRALVATKDYEGALAEADKYFGAYRELNPPVVEGNRSLGRVSLARAKALEALGRLDEARRAYAAIVATKNNVIAPLDRETIREAEERLNALGGPPLPQASQGQPQPQVQPQPKASDEPVRKNPTEMAMEEAQRAVQGLVEALKAVNLVEADRYLAIPRFDRSLVERVSPEARSKAATFRFEVGRVVLPSAVQAYITVELTYDFGAGPKTVRLPLLSG
ncbi:MAG: hypothetical protein ACK4ZX_08195, partial [Thermus sp.]